VAKGLRGKENEGMGVPFPLKTKILNVEEDSS